MKKFILLYLLLTSVSFAELQHTPSTIVTVAPVLTATPYSANDQLGDVMAISNAALDSGSGMVLEDVSVVDGAKQSIALDIFFFSSPPSLPSSDNQAINIYTESLKAKGLGHVSIVAGDYAAFANSSEATKSNINLLLRPAAGSKTIYAVMATRGTPTYDTSSLKVRFKLIQH